MIKQRYRVWVMRMGRVLVVGVLAMMLGGILSNFTEEVTTPPAVLMMQFLKHGTPQEHFLDEQGIPRLRYTRLGKELYYNPVYVAIYGLYYYDRWQQNGENAYFLRYYRVYPPHVLEDSRWLELFLATADWLVENQQVRDWGGLKYGVYEYDFPWDIYNLRPPWRSAMAQGLAIQVLVRAWLVTQDSRYLTAARLARNALQVEARDGGVTYKDTPDSWWYEEYVAPGAKESRVLNGMEHVLIALHEFYVLTGDRESLSLFRKGMNSLTANIEAYTNRQVQWTNYDRLGFTANYKYHHININLTRRLFALSGDKRLMIWREWEQLATPFLLREFVLQKPHAVDIAIVGINTLLAVPVVLLFIGAYMRLHRRRGSFTAEEADQSDNS